MAKKEQFLGTGRRKKSIARVRIMAGTGNITVNKRDVEEFFGYETLKMLVRSPFVVTETTGKYDVFVSVKGGGYTGQAGAIRHGIARALLRRVHAGAEVFDLGDCHVEFGTHRVFVAGREVALTPQEFMLLGVLVRNRNLALSREKLLQLAWGYDYEGDTRTVDVHIQKLRKKLGFEDRIQTVYKLGYRLSTKE